MTEPRNRTINAGLPHPGFRQAPEAVEDDPPGTHALVRHGLEETDQGSSKTNHTRQDSAGE